MSNPFEKYKIEFNKLINIMIKKGSFEELKSLMPIVTDFGNNYNDFCDILEEHLNNDEDILKINLFPILDSIFKCDLGKLYIDKLSNYLIDTF